MLLVVRMFTLKDESAHYFLIAEIIIFSTVVICNNLQSVGQSTIAILLL